MQEVGAALDSPQASPQQIPVSIANTQDIVQPFSRALGGSPCMSETSGDCPSAKQLRQHPSC